MSDALTVAVIAFGVIFYLTWEKMLAKLERSETVWFDHLPRTVLLREYRSRFGRDRKYSVFITLQLILFCSAFALIVSLLYGK